MVYDPYNFSDSDSESDSEGSQSVQGEDVEMATAGPGPRESNWTVASEAPIFHSTGAEESDDSRSSSPSGSSVISLTEALRMYIFKEEYGRELNNYSNVYRLPADGDEWSRLEKQHRTLIQVMGAKYPPPMGPILESTTHREKKVLDLGCGDGAWIKDVARDFPFCEAVAVDLVPIKETEDFPSNLRSEIDDLNLGLQHFYGKFDVVHVRFAASGINDYQLLIERISRVLRPGGLIELAEVDFTSYDKHGQQWPVFTNDPLGPPWWARFLAYVNDAIRASGGDADAATHLFDWITNHEAFEHIVYRDIWLPTVRGDDAYYPEVVHAAMKENISAFLKSGKPLILGSGVSEEVYNILEQNALRELEESDVPHYARVQCIYATKKHGIILEDIA